MIDIEPFVPQEVCLACRGCCRYAVNDSSWSPYFLFSEIQELTEKNIVPSCLFAHRDQASGRPARIDLVAGEANFLCPCLDPGQNVCRIYPHRPLECRFYPFLLAKKSGRVYLVLDKKCPYGRQVTGHQELVDYLGYLKTLMASDDFIRTVADNAEIIQEYPEEDLEILMALPLLDPYVDRPASRHA